MKLQNIKAVILDLDDTLLVEEESALLAFKSCAELVARRYPIIVDAFVRQARACARELWYSFPTIEYAKQVGISSWEALWAQFKGKEKHIMELRKLKDYYRTQTWKNTLDHFGIKDTQLAKKCVHKFNCTRRQLHILFEDTLPFLNVMYKKYPLALITNGIPDLQRLKIRKSGLARFFRVITISSELGTAKPDRQVFDYTLKKLDAKSREAVMIGNSLKSDIKGAQAAGMVSVWLRRINKQNGNSTDVKPDYQVDSLKHIIPLLSTC